MLTLNSRYTLFAGSTVAMVTMGALYFLPYLDPDTQCALSLACYSLLLLTLQSEQWSPMYVLRFFLLSGSGLIPPLMLFLVADGTRVMNYALPLQNRELAGYLLVLTMAALSGNALGWRFGRSMTSLPGNRFPLLDENFGEDRSSFFLFIFSVFGFLSATMLALSLGPYLWEASYTQQASAQMFGLTAYNMVCTMSVLVTFTIALLNRFRRPAVNAVAFFLGVYVLLECMLLRGMRAEVVGTVFGGFTIYCTFYRKRLSAAFMLTTFFTGFLFVYLWGAYRAMAASGFGLYDAFAYMTDGVQSYDLQGNDFYATGTFGDISATFFNAVALIESRTTPLLLGNTYFDFIPRTLPAFLYPDRPRDSSFIFYEMGYPYGGGIFELAEAYLNFHALGCFIVPFAISALLGILFEMAWTKPTVLRLVACGVFAGSIFRGTLYQSFVFYRAVTVFIVFVVLAEILYRATRRWSNWAISLQNIN